MRPSTLTAAQTAASSTPRVSTLIIVSMQLGLCWIQSLQGLGVGLVTKMRQRQILCTRGFGVRTVAAIRYARAGAWGNQYPRFWVDSG